MDELLCTRMEQLLVTAMGSLLVCVDIRFSSSSPVVDSHCLGCSHASRGKVGINGGINRMKQCLEQKMYKKR